MNHQRSSEIEGPIRPTAAEHREVFARFGLAVFHAQCVERELSILLATSLNPEFLRVGRDERERFFSLAFKETLGRLLRLVGERTQLPDGLKENLRRAVETRNWLAHDYFWFRAGSILTKEGCARMVAELEEAADLLDGVDKELTRLSDDWFSVSGVSRQNLESELQKYLQGSDS